MHLSGNKISLHGGTKIIVFFIFMNIIGFSALNLISIIYYKKSLEYDIHKQVAIYDRLFALNKSVQVPEYFVVTDRPVHNDELVLLYPGNKKNYFYLRKSYIRTKLKDFAIILFSLESPLFLLLIFFIYHITSKFIRGIVDNEKFLNLLLLSMNHKIGNFLSTQRINIDILKRSPDEVKAIDRLEKTYSKIEKDMKRTLQLVKTHSLKIKEEVNIKTIIENLIHYFDYELATKRLYPRLKDVKIQANPNDIEDICYNLIDNAVKYSVGVIHIRLSAYKKNVCIAIKNDIATNAFKGTGLGLEIAKNILKRYKGKIMIREKRNFLVTIKIPD